MPFPDISTAFTLIPPLLFYNMDYEFAHETEIKFQLLLKKEG